MKQAARIQSAIDLLTRIRMGKIPMDATIRDFMAQRRFIGSKDRTAIVERVYRAMRGNARLGWWVSQKFTQDTARLRLLADCVLSEKLSEQEVLDIFSGDKYAPEGLSAEEREFVAALQGRDLSSPDMPASVRCECPDWAEGKFNLLYGDTFEAQLSAMLEPAPLDLRVNTIKADIDTVMQSLGKDAIRTEKTTYSPIGLRAAGKPFMSDSKAFRSGQVEIQDEGSQLIALLSGVKPGMRVLDFCAGGGGKTLVMAAMMENKGNIVAMDNDTRRLEKGRLRYKKAGVHNIEVRSLEEEQHRKWLRRQKGTMDVVLVDAPCSSSGTWRRNPDLRWRFYGPSLDEILAMQSEILDRVADKVKPGGRLVYATCSLFAEENERQVTAFLERHPDYKVLPLKDAWPFKTPIPCDGEYLRMTPKQHGTDGFFAAILQKQ
jgi:16S rRNA (cytosine967-C5)-methyltransferase